MKLWGPRKDLTPLPHAEYQPLEVRSVMATPMRSPTLKIFFFHWFRYCGRFWICRNLINVDNPTFTLFSGWNWTPCMHISSSDWCYGIIIIIASKWNPLLLLLLWQGIGRMNKIDMQLPKSPKVSEYFLVYRAFHPIRGTLRPLDESKCPKTLGTKSKTSHWPIFHFSIVSKNDQHNEAKIQ